MAEEIPAARIARMRRLLNEREVLSSKQAQEEFQVSEMTVRRDFATLVRAGHARRTRGGIVPADPYFRDRSQVQRLTLEPEAKHSIGLLAADMVEDGDTIFVAGGTTCLAFARELTRRQNLTVITYSLPALMLLMANPAIEVFAPGGLASPKGDDLTGPLAEAGLSRFRARKAFIGAAGITGDGVFNSNVGRGSADETMVLQGTEAFVLADHTKIGRVSLVLVATLDQISAVVTDRPVHEADVHWLSKSNVQLVVPSDAPEGRANIAPGYEER
jgi:DeoR/GlpR family transcriptional regulator of sugar metabolism